MSVTWKKLCYEDDAILKSLVDAAGDLIVATGDNTVTRLGIGSTGDVLTVAGGTATWHAPAAPTAHNIFSASHGDVTGAASPVDGDLIIGNATPQWSKLAITVPAATFINLVGVANAETRPSWKALFDATVPTTIAASDTAAAGTATVAARRDHKHGAPASYPASTHALGGPIHTDATADVLFAGHQATNMVVHTVADNTALLALTPAVGKMAWRTDTLGVYMCTSAA